MRLPTTAHAGRSWRLDEISVGFRLEDVWALPAHGGPKHFDLLLDAMGALDPATRDSRATEALLRIRTVLGDCFGWDDNPDPLPIPGCNETTLAARLPADLRNTATGLDLGPASLTPLYRTDTEWAGEASNQTVHALIHLVWIDHGDGHHQGQLAVYVKPRGRFGAAYMALIAPFRYLIVYPALMRQIEHAWHVTCESAAATEP